MSRHPRGAQRERARGRPLSSLPLPERERARENETTHTERASTSSTLPPNRPPANLHPKQFVCRRVYDCTSGAEIATAASVRARHRHGCWSALLVGSLSHFLIHSETESGVSLKSLDSQFRYLYEWSLEVCEWAVRSWRPAACALGRLGHSPATPASQRPTAASRRVPAVCVRALDDGGSEGLSEAAEGGRGPGASCAAGDGDAYGCGGRGAHRGGAQPG